MSGAPAITLAHSPDTDDVFMFWALACGRVATPGRSYELTRKDIETLNREALDGVYDITAVSFGAYPFVAERYAILGSGASIGDRYGPVLVTREPRTLEDLAGATIAIPGRLTTAYLALRLALPEFRVLELPFKEVGPAVLDGRAAAGLLIHEGQLTWREEGLRRAVDLGEWWHERHGLPLPLGGNAIRRDLGRDLLAACAADVRRSIECGRAHRDEALRHALEIAPGLDFEQGERFLDMYVNEETVSMSEPVRRSIGLLLEEAWEAELINAPVAPVFVD